MASADAYNEPTEVDGKHLIAVKALLPLIRLCNAVGELLKSKRLIVAGVGIDPDGAWRIYFECDGPAANFEGMHPTPDDGLHALLNAFALVAHPIDVTAASSLVTQPPTPLPASDAPSRMKVEEAAISATFSPSPPATGNDPQNSQGDSASSSITPTLAQLPASNDPSRMSGDEAKVHKALFVLTEQAAVHIGGIQQPVVPVQKSILVAPAPTTHAEIDNREFVVGEVAAVFHRLFDSICVLNDLRLVLIPNKLGIDASEIKHVQHKLRRRSSTPVYIDRDREIEKDLLSKRQARKKALKVKPRVPSIAKDSSIAPGVDRPGARKRSKR